MTYDLPDLVLGELTAKAGHGGVEGLDPAFRNPEEEVAVGGVLDVALGQVCRRRIEALSRWAISEAR